MGRKQCDLCHICAKMNFSLVMCNGLNVYKQKPFLIQVTISSPVASITNVFNQSSVQINIQYNFFQWGEYFFFSNISQDEIKMWLPVSIVMKVKQLSEYEKLAFFCESESSPSPVEWWWLVMFLKKMLVYIVNTYDQ